MPDQFDVADRAVEMGGGVECLDRHRAVRRALHAHRVELAPLVVKRISAGPKYCRASRSMASRSGGVEAPHRVDITHAARPGANRIELAVTNLWPIA
jgi:hypothetical protein